MDDFELELKQGFLEESLAGLEDCEAAFLQLESNPNDQDILNQIFRLAHNLKGTSRAVGFGDIAEFTHAMENLILKIKEGELKPTDVVISMLLDCKDQIQHMVETLTDDIQASFDNAEMISKIEAMIEGGGGDSVNESSGVRELPSDDNEEETSLEVSKEPAAPTPILLKDVSEEVPDGDFFEEAGTTNASEQSDENLIQEVPKPILLTDTEMSEADEQDEPPLKVNEEVSQAEEKKASSPSKGSKPASKIDESIRVSLEKLENLNNTVGELVILQSVLNQHKGDLEANLMVKSLGQLTKISKEIHEMTMGLRMVPVRPTLQKMQRIVRDTSKMLGKEVVLKLEGEETEVDKTVVEKLNEPLVHIVRNAVDHGLERPEERVLKGKTKEGTVQIKCFHEGNNLVIEISDNGKGIDASIIRKKAIEKNVITADTVISDEQVVQLIFHPGFSTKSEVSEVSGRGVGMDVVKTNIQSLNGEVTVKTAIEQGSVFRITLPLTMAVIEGMVVQVAGEKYVFPLNQIHETMKPAESQYTTSTGLGRVLKLRGETLPVFDLSQVLKRGGGEKRKPPEIAIIVRTSEAAFAVLIDDIDHQQQIVVKSLGAEIKKRKGFMGSSILGDGRPAIILDLHELVGGQLIKINSSECNRLEMGAA